MPSRPLAAAGRARSWLQERGRRRRRPWPKNSWGFMDYAFTSYDTKRDCHHKLSAQLLSRVLESALLHEWAQNVFNWRLDSSLRSRPHFWNTSRHKDQSSCCQNNPSRHDALHTKGDSLKPMQIANIIFSYDFARVWNGGNATHRKFTDLNDWLRPRPLVP